jgi:hypothetical protein
MSNTGKVKFYKNKARTNAPTNFKPYVPQYVEMGLKSEPFHGKSEASIPAIVNRISLPKDNPRAPRPLIQQPYAETVPSPIGRGRGLLPNVGNNMEQTWSGVDNEIIDDIELDPNHPMIDNNKFVSAAALGLPEAIAEDVMEVEEEYLPEPQAQFTFPVDDTREKTFLTESELQGALQEEYLSTVLVQLEEEEYLLMVNGSSVCSGPPAEVQLQTRALVFGEHPLCDGNPIPIDDIIVLKRVKIKIGLFLE